MRIGRIHWGAAARAHAESAPRLYSPEMELLFGRLSAHGLRPIAGLKITNNRSVMVSFSRRRILSVHRGYAMAPDRVLKAIVRFVAPGTPKALRKAAEHEILSFHVEHHKPDGTRRRRDRPVAGDDDAIARLTALFHDYNARHFGGALPELPINLSGRMQTRLGHLALHKDGRPTEITISRRHLRAHGWDETAHTLLHEMVHLWQHVNGHRVDHGPTFRAKAREVGVHDGAERWVQRKPSTKANA